MKKIFGVCVVIALNLIMPSVQAQSAEQCVRSLVEPRGQELLLKGRVNFSAPDSIGLQSISLTRECLVAGMQSGRVKLTNGQLQYFQLSGRSSEGVMIHKFDPKVQLGIYSRMSYQSGTPIENFFDVYRNVSNFSYQIFIGDGAYHESISWGILSVVGDENVR